MNLEKKNKEDEERLVESINSLGDSNALGDYYSSKNDIEKAI